MAHIIPADITRAALAGARTPELQTLRQLRDQLPGDYTVFHGVHWAREYQAWTHFGEIDFVVLNRAGEALFIEQKNGQLDETEAGLTKQYEDRSQNLANQVHRSLEKVRDKFQWQHGRESRLAADYLIYLPDYRVRALNAVGLDESRVLDASQRDQLPARIQQLLDPGAPGHQAWREQVFDFFCQTYELVPDIQAHHAQQSRAYVRCSGPLADVLANLEMAPFRLRVRGTAGCGKSLMACRSTSAKPPAIQTSGATSRSASPARKSPSSGATTPSSSTRARTSSRSGGKPCSSSSATAPTSSGSRTPTRTCKAVRPCRCTASSASGPASITATPTASPATSAATCPSTSSPATTCPASASSSTPARTRPTSRASSPASSRTHRSGGFAQNDSPNYRSPGTLQPPPPRRAQVRTRRVSDGAPHLAEQSLLVAPERAFKHQPVRRMVGAKDRAVQFQR